ncbi:MAG: exodeoxyribonuclease V subunit beta [Desulfatiglandaceae bacterium]
MKRDSSHFQCEGYRPFKPFEISNIPLEGTHLVEANAGTGKTYALSGLFLRLILDEGLSPAEILVVTYTRAATQELRERIRKMIRDALASISRDLPVDPSLERLMARQRNKDSSLNALSKALRELDEAAIFTIHGFCQRLLQENAFETGSLFDVELITDEQSLHREIVEDFWRNHVYRAEPEFVHYLFEKKILPEKMLKTLGSALKHPHICVVPKITDPRLNTLDDYRKTLGALKEMWPDTKEAVRMLLMDTGIKGHAYGVATSRNGTVPGRQLKINALIAGMDQFLALERPLFPPFSDIEKFSAGKLADSMKKGFLPPEHAVFDLCHRFLVQKNALLKEMDQYLISLKNRLFQYGLSERSDRKARLNVRAYDDLLTDTLSALEGQGKEAFMRAARSMYRAALIDEFQDTDTVQYRIFATLFGTGKTSLFFIGDPKQAIYGFRGADVVTYLKASDAVSERHTLLKNWRSEPGLVKAVNTVFSRIESPFVHPGIAYSPSEIHDNGESPLLRVEGDTAAQLRLWLVQTPEGEDSSTPLPKNRAWPVILGSLATETARLITLGREGKAFVGDEPLSEKHIAVLVRKNREARWVQDALARIKVQSVLFNAGDLFETREALEIERILQGVAEPNRSGGIRAALATDIMGLNGENIHGLSKDEDAWYEWIYAFREYHRIWEERGFTSMFRRLMAREKIRSRLLAFPDGERRLTNLLHLGEVLQRAALDGDLGINALVKWLSRRLEAPTREGEEHLLRLESDEAAVKIVTVHKSKGLEYPVVFCPFLWDGRWAGEKEVMYHDPDRDLKLTLDLGSEAFKSHEALAREEALAENLRLLYVAMTRAKHRCYVAWGRIKDAETSSLAYVLHSRDPGHGSHIVERTAEAFRSLSHEGLIADLKKLEQESGGSIEVSPLSADHRSIQEKILEKSETLQCRTFSGRIARDWKITSFSSLTSRRDSGVDLPDHDGLPADEGPSKRDREETAGEPVSGIFAFPKGAKAGTCLHDILERLDFREKQSAFIRELVTARLLAHGFESHWNETIGEMLKKVLSASLDPGDPGLKLLEIDQQDRLTELEFLFPLKRIAAGELKRLFSAHGGPELPHDLPEALGRLQFSPQRGFMKGFMDLVFRWNGRFYLVDWKSNFLGDRVADYGPIGLEKAMMEGQYFLQYHLYTLALDRYLRVRLPEYRYEDHFGGAYYIFLRGVEPGRGPEFGIFRDRPSPGLIDAMRKALIAS